ncbi:AraC family transcriptional regulator [Paenibacillus silviterrae]|uniref:AraC family transcriptional regulator n=1 Tax=Paenibacillus silviterrae TaxID=3242194 RepID=UPI002543A8C1|nr:AraC family transcriptional regulator [Paenibacillus chinjuensis]
MSDAKGKARGSIFWKSLGLVLLITSIPIAFIGVILYVVGTPRIEDEVNKAYQNQLNLSIQQLTDYMTHLERSVVRLAFDRSWDDRLRIDFVQEFPTTLELMKSLSLITESNLLINSVGLYVRNSDRLIGDEAGFHPLRSEEDRRAFNALLDNEKTIYWNYSLKKINLPDTQNKAIIIKLPGGEVHGSFGVFIIYLDQTMLNTMVQKVAFRGGIAFLFNEHGEYLTSSGSGEGNREQALKDALKSRIQEDAPANSGMFKWDWQHQSYNVSYGTISKLGSKWTVVSSTPVTQITAPVTFLSSLILWISMIGLTIGLLLSWFASNKMYAPIFRIKKLFDGNKTNHADEKDEIVFIETQWKRQLQEQQALSMRLKQSLPALRDSFLLQFLQGNLYHHSESELTSKLKQLGWELEEKRFGVIVAQLHGLSDKGGKFTERDDQLITFAASNIFYELITERLSMVYIVNFQDLSVGAFFVLEHGLGNDEIKALLNKLSHDYIAAVNNVLKLKVTIVSGKISDSLVEMPAILEHTRKALRYRDLHSSNQLLDINRFMLETVSHNPFPTKLEREIVHAVSLGLEEEAVRLIRRFIVELQSENSTELMVHQGMMKLLGSLHDTIIKHGMNLYTLYEGAHLYEQLMQLSEPEQMVDWFRMKIIRPFVKKLSIAYDNELKESMDQLLERIKQNILLDVSLEMYADELQMSSSKLSKVFKEMNGVTFIDTVIRLRLEKCKELLVTTDMKINDIAELLHYQPSHLIRLFKKNEGMTPRQYREKHARI